MPYINRVIESRIRESLRHFPCVALSGPRQSGKSTLLRHLLPEYSYVTLDDPQRRQDAQRDPRLFLESLHEPSLIDEIQYAPQLLSYIKMAVDTDRTKTGRFVFTGSQQFTMIKDLGDSLAGRIALFDLLPFSIEEEQSPSSAIDLFSQAALRGMYPELVVNASLDHDTWYGSYFQTYLERDIRTTYDIGSLRDFQRFVTLIAARCGCIVNMSEYAKELGVSVPTIKRWLSLLEASRIIYLLPPFYRNIGKRLTKSPKLYFLDIGFACYLVRVRDKEHLLNGPMAGHLFENFCLQEIIKIFANAGRRAPVCYVRSNSSFEVDILIELSHDTVMPIECKLSKTPTAAMGDSIERFAEAFKKVRLEASTVVSLTDTTTTLSRTIQSATLAACLNNVKKIAGTM